MVLSAGGSRALAQDDVEAETGEPSWELHGFASQGFILTTGNAYLARSKHGSFELAEVGLNITVPLSDRLRTGMQLFSRDLGPSGNYRPSVDWFYVDYRWKDWLGVRAGRVKLPFGLYNDTSDIDAARSPILLPQSVYPTSNRDFLLAQTGAEVYGYIDLAPGGSLDYNLYAGTIFLDVPTTPGSPYVILDLRIPYVMGGRLLWESPLHELRLGGSVQGLRLTSDLGTPPAPEPVHVSAPVILWVASLEYVHRDLLLAAEYSRWHVDLESSNQMVFPDNITVSERGYAMAGYRFSPLLQLAGYYSLYFPDVDDRSGREHMQHDVALTLRLDLDLHWLLKLETHYMHGTAALSDSGSVNDGVPPAELEPDWLVFLVKTTAYW